MRRRYVSTLIILALSVTAGTTAWYLLTPPPATGTPAIQPYQIEPDVPAGNYRVVANRSRTCYNDTRAVTVTMRQGSHVDLAADTRRSHRVVRTGNRTFTYSVYQNGTRRYRRSTTEPASPTYERDQTAGAVESALYHYLPVYPQLLRYEWRAVSNESGRVVYRPHQEYWVAPATNYGVRHRLFVALAEGKLVTTADGTLLALDLSTETLRVTNRFQRHLRPRDRCTTTLRYRYLEAHDAVEPPDWVPEARTTTTGDNTTA